MKIPFDWQGANTLQARFRLGRTGTYRPLVKLGPSTGGKRNFVPGPAITLPYSPEYVPRVGLPTGEEILKSIAELTGGKPRVNPLEVLADPPRSSQTQSLLPYLFILAILCLIVEVAGRRLSLWDKLVEAAVPMLGSMKAASAPQPVAAARRAQQAARFPRAQPAATAVPAVSGEPGPQAESKGPAPAAPPTAPTATNVFEQAKHRAKRRL